MFQIKNVKNKFSALLFYGDMRDYTGLSGLWFPKNHEKGGEDVVKMEKRCLFARFYVSLPPFLKRYTYEFIHSLFRR